jgi:glucokinase
MARRNTSQSRRGAEAATRGPAPGEALPAAGDAAPSLARRGARGYSRAAAPAEPAPGTGWPSRGTGLAGPRRRLAVARDHGGFRVHHLGIDIGGSSAKLSLLDGDLRVRFQDLVALPDVADDPRANRAARVALVERAILDASAAGAHRLTVGIATPGIVDAEHRRIVSLPGKLAGLEGLDWREALEARAPAARAPSSSGDAAATWPPPIAILNDAHAAVLGEARLGAGRGCDDLAMLTLGTGVGGGVVLGGRLLEGRNRRAGHLGHVSLDPYGEPSVFATPGSLEWHLGNAYLPRRSGGRYATNEDLAAAVRRGEAAAVAEWGRMVRALAVGIASIINVLDCERVILGGGLLAAEDLLFGPLARELDQVEWRPTGVSVAVVAAELGRHSGSIGAALFGRERSGVG